jgi:protein associated with RNAse G/E
MKQETLCFYNLHFPSEVRVSEFSKDCIRLHNDSILIYDFIIHTLILRHFVFYDKWFDIHCFLAKTGDFEILPGPIDCCFDCDISTPLFHLDNNFYNIDLEYDILVGKDGKTYEIKDEEEFQSSINQGWISPLEQEGARKGLEELKEILNTTGLISFLDTIYPFKGKACAGESQRTYKMSIDEVSILKKDARQKYITK